MNNTSHSYVFVWPLCTRIIHWIIALSFFLSFVTSFFYPLFKWHVAFGFIFGIVLLFRIIWGFIGPSYAKFKTFKLNPEDLKFYFVEKIQNRWRTIYAGHNAASSWFTLIVLLLGSFIVLSGFLLQGMQEATGLFAFLNPHYFSFSPMVGLGHQILSYLLFACAIVHIFGVLIEQFYHKTNMLFAMITGYKKAKGAPTYISMRLQFFAYGIIFLCFATLLHVKMTETTFLTHTHVQERNFKTEAPAYARCEKCHKTYPPFMLPHDSWVRLMEGLENHFGERITEDNITKAEQQSIQEYLMTHSAEHSSHKLAFNTLLSLKEQRPLSMRKVPYWREIHKNVPMPEEAKQGSNCFTCHINFEYGILDKAHIRLP